MKEYTITPINTGMVNSNKANYLYHNSTERRQEDPDRHRNVQY